MRTKQIGLAWLAGAILTGAGAAARPVSAQQAAPASPEITVYKSPT